MVKNALDQSDCRTLESNIFQVRTDESDEFLAYRYRFKKCGKLFINFSFARVKMLLANQITGFIN